jgi:hypothetical protein
MRNSRGGLGDIPSLGKAGALPASAQSRRVKARGQVCGPKGRPFRQRVNAVCRALPRYDLTPEHRGRHCASRGRLGPSAWVGRRRSARPAPHRGMEMLDIWKWRRASFPKGSWKSFPTELLEMEEVQDSRQISKGALFCFCSQVSASEVSARRSSGDSSRSGPVRAGRAMLSSSIMIPLWNRGLTSLATANRAGGAHGFSAMMS